jgi:hypothetical protein
LGDIEWVNLGQGREEPLLVEIQSLNRYRIVLDSENDVVANGLDSQVETASTSEEAKCAQSNLPYPQRLRFTVSAMRSAA